MISVFCLSSGASKPSLKQLTTQFKQGEAVTKAFAQDRKKISSPAVLLEQNRNLRAQFFSDVRASSAFVRGEIEDESVLNFVTNFLQLSLLRARYDLSQGNAQSLQEELRDWFNFSADLSYEESSLIGLRLASLVRSLCLDELEWAIHEQPKLFVNAGLWIKSLRAPWPVDRVFLFESKRQLKAQSLAVAEKVAQAFQKNPYQTAEEILRRTPGGTSADLEFLKSIWRDSDLKAMKTEVNRLSLLRVRAANLKFEAVKKTKAKNWQELKDFGGLEQVPIDYFSGRPMEWTPPE